MQERPFTEENLRQLINLIERYSGIWISYGPDKASTYSPGTGFWAYTKRSFRGYQSAPHKETVIQAALSINNDPDFFETATTFENHARLILQRLSAMLIAAGQLITDNDYIDDEFQVKSLRRLINTYQRDTVRWDQADWPCCFDKVNNAILAEELTRLTGHAFDRAAIPASREDLHAPYEDKLNFDAFVQELKLYSGVALELPPRTATIRKGDHELGSQLAEQQLSRWQAIKAIHGRIYYHSGLNYFAEPMANLILEINATPNFFHGITFGYYGLFLKVADAIQQMLKHGETDISLLQQDDRRWRTGDDGLYTLLNTMFFRFNLLDHKDKFWHEIQATYTQNKEANIFQSKAPYPLLAKLIRELESYTGYRDTLKPEQGKPPEKGFLCQQQVHHECVVGLLNHINQQGNFFEPESTDAQRVQKVIDRITANLAQSSQEIGFEDRLRMTLTAFLSKHDLTAIDWYKINEMIMASEGNGIALLTMDAPS